MIDRTSLRLSCFAAAAVGLASFVHAGEHVEVRVGDGDAVFLVDGQPLRIKGAGGSEDLELLAQSGGNAIRTWGVGDDTPELLDRAQANGLKVVLGVWLKHERHGFDYNDDDFVAEQLAEVREAVEKYKDHPALLAWSLGNEMEGFGDGDDAAIWSHVEAVAALTKRLDPHHPTMTVMAEVGGNRVQNVHRLCPSIDIVGLNSYAGSLSLPERYRANVPDGYEPKPYVVTEYGPPGTWEVGRNSFNAAEELTSTQKADIYRNVYETLEADSELNLGSFAFTWGAKREATSTWFGLFLHDGSKLGGVDALADAWGGSLDNRSPTIEPLKITRGTASANAGETVTVATSFDDPDGDRVELQWTLSGEQETYFTGGDTQPELPSYPDALDADGEFVTVTLPSEPGVYRLYAVVRDGNGGAATANLPLFVKGGAAMRQDSDDEAMEQAGGESKKPEAAVDDAPDATLPLVLIGDDAGEAIYVPSGYMGEATAISMNDASRNDPHSGDTCLRVMYDKPDAWGGVVWQSPANDWGAANGGLDLNEATKLTFWARGGKGGERVNFGLGGIGRDQPFFDTADLMTEVTLTAEWKQYEIDLTSSDLSRIKSGFKWSAAGQGEALLFYLDDVRYE